MIDNVAPVPLHGTASVVASAGGFRIRRAFYPGGLRLAPHRHPFPYLAATLDGRARQTVDGRMLERAAGALIYHAAGELHADLFHPPGVLMLHVEILAAGEEALAGARADLPAGADLACPEADRLLARLHRELLRGPAGSPLILAGLVLELLGALCPPGEARPPVPKWLERAHALISARFVEPLGLAAVAREAGVHPVHLARAFHRRYGCTVGDKIRQLRIESACHDLTRSRLPLSEIALAAGFADQSHFCRSFRSHFGMTPGEYARPFRQVNSVQAG